MAVADTETCITLVMRASSVVGGCPVALTVTEAGRAVMVGALTVPAGSCAALELK